MESHCFHFTDEKTGQVCCDSSKFTHLVHNNRRATKGLFSQIMTVILNFTLESKGPNLPWKLFKKKKKKQAKGLVPSDNKASFKTIVIKTVWYLKRGRQTDKWKRREKMETSPGLMETWQEPNRADMQCNGTKGTNEIKSWLHGEMKQNFYLQKQTSPYASRP